MTAKDMNALFEGHCKACEGDVDKLDRETLDQALQRLEGWELEEKENRIRREFGFDNYHQTMAFVNAVAWIAHTEDHHPDMEVTYNSCTVTYSTHSVGGLTRNDTLSAAKVNDLLSA